MPIRPFLNGERFDPETTRVLGVAFEMVCIALRIGDCDDFVRRAIATKIIDLAKVGERDPDLLCEQVLRDICGRKLIILAATLLVDELIEARLLRSRSQVSMWHFIMSENTIPTNCDLMLAVADRDGLVALEFPCRWVDGCWIDTTTRRLNDTPSGRRASDPLAGLASGQVVALMTEREPWYLLKSKDA